MYKNISLPFLQLPSSPWCGWDRLHATRAHDRCLSGVQAVAAPQPRRVSLSSTFSLVLPSIHGDSQRWDNGFKGPSWMLSGDLWEVGCQRRVCEGVPPPQRAVRLGFGPSDGEWACHALYTEGPLSSHLRLFSVNRPAATLSAGILPTLQRASCFSVAGVQITLGSPQTD